MAGPTKPERPKTNTTAKKPVNKPKTKTKTLDPNDTSNIFKCTRCGKSIKGDAKGYFYMSKSVGIYNANGGGYCSICIDCCNEIFREFKAKYSDERLAIILTCCATGLYYSEELYASMREKILDTFGTYAKCLNGTQYRNKSFNTFLLNLVEGNLQLKDYDELREAKEIKWKQADRKNKKYVIETVGYDPFDDDSYSDANRVFLFNTLADYLTDEVIEDPHKTQSVIALVKTTLQKESVDVMINAELRKAQPDYPTIKQLAEVKDKLGSDIIKTAKENGISASSSGKSGKSSNTLTAIMKEMSDNGFDEIKVNVYDVKQSESYKEVSMQNAKALIAELNFTGDDYARMVGEQSEILRKLQKDLDDTQEELRITKKALKDEQEKGGKKK